MLSLVQVPQSIFYNPTINHEWIDTDFVSGTLDDITVSTILDSEREFIAYSYVDKNNIDFSKFKVVRNDSEVFVNNRDNDLHIEVSEPLYNNAKTSFAYLSSSDTKQIVFTINACEYNTNFGTLPVGYTCNYKLYYDNQLLANINMTIIEE